MVRRWNRGLRGRIGDGAIASRPPGSIVNKNAVDTVNVLIQDSSILFSSLLFLVVTDTVAINYGEASIKDELPGGDTQKTTFDSVLVLVSEGAPAIVSTSTRTDSLAVLVSEALTVINAMTRTDTLSLMATEGTVAMFSTLARTDNVIVTVSETKTLAGSSSRTDNINVLVTDAVSSAAVLLSKTDTLSVTATEGTVGKQVGMIRTDSLLPMITEVSDLVSDNAPEAVADLVATDLDFETVLLEFTPSVGATSHEWRFTPYGAGSWSAEATLPDNTGSNEVTI